jgi:hypothetical protein
MARAQFHDHGRVDRAPNPLDEIPAFKKFFAGNAPRVAKSARNAGINRIPRKLVMEAWVQPSA